jgi:hypothetical protein
MRFHMSSVSAPSPATGGALPHPPPGPAIVRRTPPKPRNIGPWILLVVLALAGGAAYYLLRERVAPGGPGGGGGGSRPYDSRQRDHRRRTVRVTAGASA